MSHPFSKRRGGVLCHLGCLAPHPFRAVGAFLDFLDAAGLRIWQTLPLNPPDRFGSPYSSTSLFAINPRLSNDIREDSADFEVFCLTHEDWLDDFAAYEIARAEHGQNWRRWPDALRRHDPEAVAEIRRDHASMDRSIRLSQFRTFTAWWELRAAAAERDILLFGDLPLYPALDSVDVWAHQSLFELSGDGVPTRVAGVPPDYFSSTGQLWGNPLYRWSEHEATGFRWWIDRLTHQLHLFDVVRIDHFRGLESFWAVKRGATSALEGSWVPAPGHKLLEAFRSALGEAPLVAEDLGVITPEVDALRQAFDLPGMRVLQFAFSGDPRNPHLPAQLAENTVCYTGTHDNDTTLGWYGKLGPEARKLADGLVDGATDAMPWPFIEAALASRANSVIVPLQDFLALGSRARMNTPGRAEGNWGWRAPLTALDDRLSARIRDLIETTGRV